MIRSRRSTSNNKLPPFVPLTWELLNSKAYRELPPSAAKALPYFKGKVKVPFRDIARYTTPFQFPYSEALRLGFARATFSEIIRNLVHYGFVDPHTRGALKGYGYAGSKFHLSLRWKAYGTKEFVSIEWLEFFPAKSNIGSKSELHKFNSRTENNVDTDLSSKNEPVGAQRA